jgi:hypothetical protein
MRPAGSQSWIQVHWRSWGRPTLVVLVQAYWWQRGVIHKKADSRLQLLGLFGKGRKIVVIKLLNVGGWSCKKFTIIFSLSVARFLQSSESPRLQVVFFAQY